MPRLPPARWTEKVKLASFVGSLGTSVNGTARVSDGTGGGGALRPEPGRLRTCVSMVGYDLATAYLSAYHELPSLAHRTKPCCLGPMRYGLAWSVIRPSSPGTTVVTVRGLRVTPPSTAGTEAAPVAV